MIFPVMRPVVPSPTFCTSRPRIFGLEGTIFPYALLMIDPSELHGSWVNVGGLYEFISGFFGLYVRENIDLNMNAHEKSGHECDATRWPRE